MTRDAVAPDDVLEGSLDNILKRCLDEGDDTEIFADAALGRLELLLDREHLQLASMHACDYEAVWDDARKLVILERFHRHGMDAQAITLCHRWKLSALCDTKNHKLYRELFPKLQPRTDKKEKP